MGRFGDYLEYISDVRYRCRQLGVTDKNYPHVQDIDDCHLAGMSVEDAAILLKERLC
jgi:hypothetical protein